MNSLSSMQFSVGNSLNIDTSTPTQPSASPLNAQSNTSAGKATAWSTKGLSHNGTPLPYAKKTRGSYVSWDDDNGNANMPQSDTGANFAQGR